MKQKALTREQYAALGYVEIGDLSSIGLKLTPDRPLRRQLFPAYRAETKEEFAVDFAIGVSKIAAAAATGGTAGALRTGLGYTFSLLT